MFLKLIWKYSDKYLSLKIKNYRHHQFTFIVRKNIINFSVIIGLGLIAALLCQLLIREPVDRNIHIRSFRYGKDPYEIRCNRGDRLHLTFSTDDTGHSFFLEEFNVDAKVSPLNDEVTVFKPSDPTLKPEVTKEITLIAKHPGIDNYVVSRSAYRCHVWCGPMHAFEQGKLIIWPNTLLFFGLGGLAGLLLIFFFSIFRKNKIQHPNKQKMEKDILAKSALRKLFSFRWPQLIMVLFGFLMIYVVVITCTMGTKVSGRNFGVLLMWAIWLFVLVAILTPIAGRAWCSICPLPFLGDWFQRRSFFSPERGNTKGYNNHFYGLFLKWPEKLKNNWFKLFVFLLLSTFSTTLVAVPEISGLVVLSLFLIPTFMSGIFELRAFCRYVCPVTVFLSPFSGMSLVGLKNKDQSVCNKCKGHYCQKGSPTGWACPYGINVGEMTVNTDCGLCLECLRSCPYKNVSLYKRPFGTSGSVRDWSEAWLSISIFIMAIVYSVVYLGPWPAVRDYVNIIDKGNWNLFGIYTILIWSLVLLVFPLIIYALSLIGTKISKAGVHSKDTFLGYVGSLLPLGLMLWISFVIPMLFVNITFILQASSDPFGWGWDFFGTAGTPWHQFIPQYIPWIQILLILFGLYLSLENIQKIWSKYNLTKTQLFWLSLPGGLFLTGIAAAMINFFCN